MKLFILSLLFPILFLPSSKEKGLIQWEKNRLLTWKDFKAKTPKGNHGMVAETNWSWDWEETLINGEQRLIPIWYFKTSGSWTSTKDEYILAHEQLHFDIGELFVRKLRKKLLENPEIMNDYKQFNHEFKKYFARCVEQQRLYDKETNHSIYRKQQSEWNNATEKELMKYDLFDYQQLKDNQ